MTKHATRGSRFVSDPLGAIAAGVAAASAREAPVAAPKAMRRLQSTLAQFGAVFRCCREAMSAEHVRVATLYKFGGGELGEQ